MSKVLGIHHVTAIASDPQRNVDFYAGVLGLRLVKRTINFDDPTTYHLYFGDERGNPGSIITFFPWPDAARGRPGAGRVAVVSFAIHPRAIEFWGDHLRRHRVTFEGPTQRGAGADAEQVIAFEDPDGLLLELVAHPAADARPAWDRARGIPAAHAIHGIHGVTIWVDEGRATDSVLTNTLGFRLVREDETAVWGRTRDGVDDRKSLIFEGRRHGTRRFAVGDGGPGRIVNVRSIGRLGTGTLGAGTVHHVAFAVCDDAGQLELRAELGQAGLEPTPVIDRKYFRSVYFDEPGGVLFELATVGPGFTVDEPLDLLGTDLMLPVEYELERSKIKAVLPPIHAPVASWEEGALADATVVQSSSPGAEAGEEPTPFVHRWIPAHDPLAARWTLLVLHGTGGDEDDLVPLGRALLPDAGVLSPRGQVRENGAARWFRRVAEGVFDQEDLARRTYDLAEFVRFSAARHAFDETAVIAVGFSNGANIATSLLLRQPGLLRAAVLLSPTFPYDPERIPDLTGTAVFIGAGRNDPVAPASQVERLASLLHRTGADVTVHWTDGGHELANSEVTAARSWLARLVSTKPDPARTARSTRAARTDAMPATAS